MHSANIDCIKMIFVKSSLRLKVFPFFLFCVYHTSKGERKESTRKARMLFLWFSFSLFEPITRASRWPPFAAGYVNERITKDKTNAVRGLLQGSPSNFLIRDIQSLGNGDGEPCALLVFPRKNDHRRPNSSARKEIQGVLFTCVCLRFPGVHR